MKKKIGFAVAIILVGVAILSTRYYEVNLPVWHFLGGGNGPDPATLHLKGEFVERAIWVLRRTRTVPLPCA